MAAGGADREFAAGDKVAHPKWGEGVVVSVKGTGNDMELQIAFPAPTGIKRLLAVLPPLRRFEAARNMNGKISDG
ncbi:hypothetical protein PACILC2_57040 [Paenibacillus cisolokensis]|uniref:DUF3553 domain-containing protein n=1 Tax=Paenibacillus cisolokensis TaxID=1658519 RepID=A0ABQ4NFW9_9BACL|nr:hypothetical protein PACILC2_57040 [Paenibacillus cisolokensis]